MGRINRLASVGPECEGLDRDGKFWADSEYCVKPERPPSVVAINAETSGTLEWKRSDNPGADYVEITHTTDTHRPTLDGASRVHH